MASPVDSTYAVDTGVRMYAGRLQDYGELTRLIKSMSPNTFAQISGTNINEKTAPPPGNTYYSLGGMSVLEVGGYSNLMPPWCGKTWMDPNTGLMGALGCTAGFASQPDASKAFYLDPYVPLNQGFTVAYNPTSKAEGHYYDGNCSRPLKGYVYRRGYNNTQIWRMNVKTRVWELFGTFATIADQVVALEVFPELGPNGSIVCVGAFGQLYSIDAITKVVTSYGTFTGSVQYCICIYLSGPKCIVFGAGTNVVSGSGYTETGNKLWKLDSSGTVTLITSTYAPGMTQIGSSANQGPTVPHPDGNSILCLSGELLQVWKMDVSGTWTYLSDLPTPFNFRNPTGGLPDVLNNTLPCTMHGQGAILLWYAKGRDVNSNIGNTTSQFWIYKVPN